MNRYERMKDFGVIRDEIEDLLDQIWVYAWDGCPEGSIVPGCIKEVQDKIRERLQSLEIIAGELYGQDAK